MTKWDKKRNELIAKAHRWRQKHVSDAVFTFVVALLIGLCTGVGAFVLKYLIGHISTYLTQNLALTGYNLHLLILPLAGILITGIYVRYIAREPLTHGTSCIMHDMSRGISRLNGSLTYAPIIGCSITLGCGGSAGSEGPIAYAGAAMGSNIGRMFRVHPRFLMMLVGCGAGAGIAAIFKAPVGGMLFTLEVLKMELTTLSVVMLLSACLISALTAYVLSGCTVDIDYAGALPFDTSTLPFVLLLGVFCGVYSLYYSGVMKRMDRFFSGLRNPWIKNIIAGLSISVLVFLFPAFYGEGYGIIGKVLNGAPQAIADYSMFYPSGADSLSLLLIIGCIALLKSFITSATNSGGGVGGDFAPTLFAGSMAGLFFVMSLNMYFGTQLDSGNFAYFAMAGVMAGAIHAPLMAIFLTVEMTGQYTLLLPLTIVASISYGVVKLFRDKNFLIDRIEFWYHSHRRHVSLRNNGAAPADKN